MEPLDHLFVQSIVRERPFAPPRRTTRRPAWRRLVSRAVREARRYPLPTRKPVSD